MFATICWLNTSLFLAGTISVKTLSLTVHTTCLNSDSSNA